MAAKIWINGMGIVGRELFREIVRGGVVTPQITTLK
mgnify:CR=1 FL=1